MDIGASSWILSHSYKVNDIVKLDYLDQADTDIFIRDGGSNREHFGDAFKVNPNWGYNASSMVRRISDATSLTDNYTTFITESEGLVNVEESIGIGVGIKFYDKNMKEVAPNDRRNTCRAIPNKELESQSYYKLEVDIPSHNVPAEAVYGTMFVFAYGLNHHGFKFKNTKARNLSPYFYCIKDHISEEGNIPNSESEEEAYWTQNFIWRPSYGSKSSFAAINEQLELGEGADYINNKSLNSLPMELNLSFNNRTDQEAKAIVHFLQEKHFAYDSIFSVDYKGDRLKSGDVSAFRFTYTHPYKQDLMYTCVDFSHSIQYRNNNQIQARFICDTESVLSSIESNAGYNSRLDCLIPIYIDEDIDAQAGESVYLKTFSLEELSEGLLEDVHSLVQIGFQEALLRFKEDKEMLVGDAMYIIVRDPEDSFYDKQLVTIQRKVDRRNYILGPVRGSGVSSPPIDFEIHKLTRHPKDCLHTQVKFPDGLDSIKNEVVGDDGVTKLRSLFLKNYKKVNLLSTVDRESSSIVVSPDNPLKLTKGEKFNILIPAARGRHSIYLKDPNRIDKFPYLKVRNFEQLPSMVFNLQNTPRHISSNFLDYYNKKYKKDINPNLSKFTITFDQRSDEEALEILQFLESHLGFMKFRFNMPRPYTSNGSVENTPSRSNINTFYCPSWDHEVVYKNNHKITATFIESITSIETYDDEDPCYGVYLSDTILERHLCTFSSGLQAARGNKGFNDLSGLALKRKVVEIVFIIDSSGSMSERTSINGVGIEKWSACIDILKKSVTAYDDYITPGTNSYNGLFETPAFSNSQDVDSEDRTGDNDIPPWPANGQGKTRIDFNQEDIYRSLYEDGYNIDNLDRFKVRIEPDKVGFGLVVSGSGVTKSFADLSDLSISCDKVNVYNVIASSAGHRGNTDDIGNGISLVMSQFYNSKRAADVTDRIIVAMTDALFFRGDAGGFISPIFRSICEQIRPGGELAKKRPDNSILRKYGNIYSHLESYKTQKNEQGKSKYNHFSEGGDNDPPWYQEEVPTIMMLAGIGGQLAPYCATYAHDWKGASAPYTPNSEENKNTEFFFDLSGSTNKGQEGQRLLSLISIIESIAKDSGYENLFSVTVHNCGPKDVVIKNTVVNLKSEEGDLRWTTEKLETGIPKGGSLYNPGFIESNNEGGELTKPGYGGQYVGDPNNQRILSTGDSDVLWESFNTKYEVYRSGKVHLIDGGWGKDVSRFQESKGVKNAGVAFKGMPVRVFKSSKNIQILDYNISNVVESNQYQGDYSHIPVLKAGESIDLFFGVRLGDVVDLLDEVQLIFNTDDGTIKKTESYANITFPITSGKFKKTIGLSEIEAPNFVCNEPGSIFSKVQNAFELEFRNPTGKKMWQVLYDSVGGSDTFTDRFVNPDTGSVDANTIISKVQEQYHCIDPVGGESQLSGEARGQLYLGIKEGDEILDEINDRLEFGPNGGQPGSLGDYSNPGWLNIMESWRRGISAAKLKDQFVWSYINNAQQFMDIMLFELAFFMENKVMYTDGERRYGLDYFTDKTFYIKKYGNGRKLITEKSDLDIGTKRRITETIYELKPTASLFNMFMLSNSWCKFI